MKYLIKYGVTGGFNDADNYLILECETQGQAEDRAYEKAIEVFDSYDVESFDIEVSEEEDPESFYEGFGLVEEV
jgi:hypothetical protein